VRLGQGGEELMQAGLARDLRVHRVVPAEAEEAGEAEALAAPAQGVLRVGQRGQLLLEVGLHQAELLIRL